MANAPNHSRFSLSYDDEPTARTIARSLGQEVGEIDDDRSRTTLDRDGRTVRIEVAAADRVALRAAMNTWLSLATVAERASAIGARRGTESGDF